MRPRIVEFFGPPGSGKSTLCTALTAVMADKAWRVLSVEDQRALRSLRNARGRVSLHKILGLVGYALTHVDLCLLILIAVHQAGWSIARLKQAAVLFRAIQTNAACLQICPGVIPREEGVVQALWGLSIGGKLPSERVIHSLLGRAFDSSSAVLVFLDLPPMKAFTRMRNRGANYRLDRLDDRALIRCLEENLGRFEVLADEAEKNRVAVLVVDGDQDISANLNRLLRELGKCERDVGVRSHAQEEGIDAATATQSSDRSC